MGILICVCDSKNSHPSSRNNFIFCSLCTDTYSNKFILYVSMGRDGKAAVHMGWWLGGVVIVIGCVWGEKRVCEFLFKCLCVGDKEAGI